MTIEGDYSEEDWFGEVRVDGMVLDPRPSQKVWNHSPDGFAWGYNGSAPAQLALAILLAAGVSQVKATTLHQRFKAQFIGPLPRANFKIEVDIDTWIKETTTTHVTPTETS